jgi:hypothetical protein
MHAGNHNRFHGITDLQPSAVRRFFLMSAGTAWERSPWLLILGIRHLARFVQDQGHEEDTTCFNPVGRGFKFRAVIDRRENWATAPASRYSRPATSPGTGLLLGGRLLVPSRKPLQVA